MKKIISGFLAVLILSVGSLAHAAITSTFSNLKGPYSIGGYSKMATASLATSGTYVSGGFTLSPSTFGLNYFESVQATAPSGYNIWWDSANAKLVLYTNGTSTEPSGTTTLTGINLTVIGN